MTTPEVDGEEKIPEGGEWIYVGSDFALRRTAGEVWIEVRRLPLAPLEVLEILRSVAPEVHITREEVFRAASALGSHRVGVEEEKSEGAPPRVVVDEAGMTCRLYLSPGFLPLQGGGGGLRELLDREGVVFGVDHEALDRAWIRAAAGEAVRAVVARGVPPGPGEDGRVEFFFSPPTGRPVEDASGNVDHYHLDLIVPVQEGAVVAVCFPPTKGRAGRTVRGEEVPPRNGRPAPLDFGEGLYLSENGELVAKFSGALRWKGSRILLERVLVISGDVGSATGNVSYDGPVLVKGSVRGGFAVEAGGDVEVAGSVEDAAVTSRQGKVSVRYGIQGRGRAVVRAGGDVMARFVQEAEVECETLMVNEYILRSTVNARKGVLVEGGKGIITASEICARGHVHAKDVRSFREGDTRIDIPGVPRRELFRDYQALEKEIETLKDHLSALAAEVRALGPGAPEIRDLLGGYMEKADALADREERLAELGEFLRKMKGDATFGLRGSCSRGVNLRLRGISSVTQNAMSSVTLFYDANEERVVAVELGGA